MFIELPDACHDAIIHLVALGDLLGYVENHSHGTIEAVFVEFFEL